MSRRIHLRSIATALLGVSLLGALAMTGDSLASASAARVVSHSSPPSPIKGIDVVMDDTAPLTIPNEVAQARNVFAYVQSLNANAISLSFPFYDATWTSNDPHKGAGTPSPAELAAVIGVARQDGFTVQLRPYLSETNLNYLGTGHWRGAIQPTNVKLWFSTYESFIKPYEIAGRRAGATSFTIAVELNSLINDLTYWNPIIHDAKAIFGPNVSYSATDFFQTLPGTQFQWDAYQPINVANQAAATVPNLTAGFIKNFAVPLWPAALRSSTVGEVWIAAVSGAYAKPYYLYWANNTPVLRSMQTNWFAAACNAFWQDHMAGIYFWSVGFNHYHVGEDDETSFESWIGTAAATSIKNCFARTS